MRRDWSTLLAVAAVQAAFLLALENLWLLAASLALAALSIIASRWARALLVPRGAGRWVGIGLVAGAALLYSPTPSLDNIVPAVGVSIVAVIAVRLWLRGAEDLPTLHLCAVLLALAAFLANALVPVLLIIVSVPLIIHAEMGERIRRARAEAGAHVERIASVVGPASGQAAGGPALRVATAWLVTLASIAAVALFIGFPRRSPANPWWGGGGRVGYSVVVDLERSGPIAASRREVLRMVIRDPDGERSGALGTVYLKAGTLNRYDASARVWEWVHEGPAYLHVRGDDWVALGAAHPSGAGGIWEADLATRGIRLSATPMPRPAFALATPTRETVALIRSSGDILMADLAAWSIRFKPFATATDLALLGAEGPVWRRQQGSPEDFPEAVRHRADAIEATLDPGLAGWERAAAFAAEAKRTLSSPPFRYTDAPPELDPATDPIEAFLVQSHAGHCERYASALVALCQAAGYEARIATGFLASEYNEMAGSYTVRESDAHAWPEVRVGPDRWEVMDPSPVQRLLAEREGTRSWVDAVLAVLAPAEEVFSRFVVGFDRTSQEAIVRAAASLRDWLWKDGILALAGRLRDVAEWLAPDPASAWRARLWTVSLGAAIAATGLALVVHAARRERLRRLFSPVRLYRAPPARILVRCARFRDLPGRIQAACGPRPAGATLLGWVDGAPRIAAGPRDALRAEVLALYAARFAAD